MKGKGRPSSVKNQRFLPASPRRSLLPWTGAQPWEKGRQLKSFGTNSYTYNANGVRTSKTVNGEKHTYFLEGTTILQERWGENTLEATLDNEGQLCGIVYNRKPYFFLKNLQGDIIAICDEKGESVARYSYDAWGKCTIVEDTTDFGLATINPYRYRGYYYDTETGLYYLQSRYYDPEIGRFINADHAAMLYSTNGKGRENVFSYCKNNIVNKNDPFGYLSGAAAASSFALQYGFSYVGKALLLKLTSFLVSVAPYLLVAVAVIAVAYASYVIAQKVVVKTVQKKIPNKLLKNGKVDLSKFTKNRKGRSGKEGPDGWYIEKDYSKHGGSVWKLFNKAGQRIASLFGDGAIRGK